MSIPSFYTSQQVVVQKMLDMVELQQEAIASNIANEHTPDYKALALDKDTFSKQLQEALRGNTNMHNIKPTVQIDKKAKINANGNSVDREAELIKSKENAMMHQFLTQYISTDIKHIRTAISGNINR